MNPLGNLGIKVRSLVKILLCTSAILCTSCGEDGDEKKTPAPSSPAPEPSTGVNEGKTDISGYVRVDLTGVYGYVVRVYDLESGRYLEGYSDDTGYVSISLKETFKNPITGTNEDFFSPERSYAFYLLTPGRRRIGLLDFSSADDVQAGLTYSGGSGFDFGFLDLATNGFGLITSTVFSVTPGGDFSVDATSSGELSDLELPAFLDRFGFGEQLVVGEPRDVYTAFVDRANSPEEYGKALNRYGGVFFDVEVASGESIELLAAVEKFTWFKDASMRYGAFTSPLDVFLWKTQNYILNPTEGRIDAVMRPSLRDREGGYMNVVLKHGDGSLYYIDRYLGKPVVRPPLIYQVDLGEASLNLAAPADDSTGMLSLFELDPALGPVVFSLLRPATAENIGVSETLVAGVDRISVTFQYYNGVFEVEPETEDFGPVHYIDQTDLSNSKIAGSYSWDVSQKRLVATGTPSSDSAACSDENPSTLCLDQIEIPSALFLEGVTSIDRIKIGIMIEGPSVRSGSAFWVARP